ncbi:MAG: NAD-dependent epimerase/dehydratase family protein, partial [Rhodothermales bacterium]|nr:NAD-dependent epimerase/dehydratase family protein [Rhodothermales bacterium]
MAQRFTYTSELPHPPEEVFAWHERPGALHRLSPPWMPVTLESHEGLRDGDRASIRLGWGPLGVTWLAEHRDYVEGRSFTDVQVKGPFASWTHRHIFEPSDEGCRLVDDIHFEMPAKPLGSVVAGCAKESLRSQFAYRHTITANDLRLHGLYGGRRLRVAVTGSSGLIGSSLTAFLRTGGHTVIRLVRRRPVGSDELYWNVRDDEIDAEGLEGLDAVVHLAGENLMAPRWTEAKKRRIYDSRVQGTTLLAKALAGLSRPP